MKEYKFVKFDNFFNKYIFFINIICSSNYNDLYNSDNYSNVFIKLFTNYILYFKFYY